MWTAGCRRYDFYNRSNLFDVLFDQKEDVRDDYSEGYDDAINAALDILLRETGYTIEDVLDNDEDGKE